MGDWDRALHAYDSLSAARGAAAGSAGGLAPEEAVGRMACLERLGRWSDLQRAVDSAAGSVRMSFPR